MGMTTQYSDLKFVTPPKNQGQIVEISFAIDADREEVVCRIYDRGDRTTKYDVTPLENLKGEFEPWNGEPSFYDYDLWERVS